MLRSLELLQLRRDRVAKSSNIVERNQCLIIDMPDLLKRFLILLRVANYGPNLADLARYNINAQDSPGNADLVTFISMSRNNTGTSEWDHLLSLDAIVKKGEAAGELSNATRKISDGQRITAGRVADDPANADRLDGTRMNQNRVQLSDLNLDETMTELLAAFAPGADVYGQRPMTVSLLNIVQIAQSLGLTAIAPDGEPIPLHDTNDLPSVGYESFSNTVRSFGIYRRGALSSTGLPAPPTPTVAKKELQFHAMFLNPHHVELLFVLCTLLSGRRKINVQQKLASLGLADILLEMYGRMSWESKPFHGHNPMEHIHGPGCDCNPESALRVQYLRLVHNSYDRDFLGDSNKMALLSTAEREVLDRCSSPSEVSKDGFFIDSRDRGIFTRIVQTLLKEPVESVYRFWLSSCLESFLRGSGPKEQVFIAISGILSYTVTHIVDTGIRPSASANLQTAFDLLGELVKGNHHTIEMVDSALGDTNFERFMDAVMSNLVDSNVFVRSLYLSIDAFSDSDIGLDERSARQDSSQCLTPGYLSHSWVQFSPSPLSKQAIDVLKSRGSCENKNLKQSSSSKAQSRRSPSTANRREEIPRTGCMGSRSASNSESGSTSSSIPASSRVTSGVRGALQNIREAANHFLTFSAPTASSSSLSTETLNPIEAGFGNPLVVDARRERQTEFVRHNSQQNVFVPLLKENKDLDGEVECDYDEFFTPPEAPYYPRSRPILPSVQIYDSVRTNDERQAQIDSPAASASIHALELSNLADDDSAGTTRQPTDSSVGSCDGLKSATVAVKEGEMVGNRGYPNAKEAVRGKEPAVISAGLHRFHNFLIREKEYVLLKLMITVTMYTINHENICCLNSALLILLLSKKRFVVCKQ